MTCRKSCDLVERHSISLCIFTVNSLIGLGSAGPAVSDNLLGASNNSNVVTALPQQVTTLFSQVYPTTQFRWDYIIIYMVLKSLHGNYASLLCNIQLIRINEGIIFKYRALSHLYTFNLMYQSIKIK